MVSLYSPDSNSPTASGEVNRLSPTLLLTPLGELELFNALELRVFRRQSSVSEANMARAMIRKHIRSGFLSAQAMPPTTHEQAQRIAVRRTRELGVRTLDILHVAIALLLKAELFLTFDDRQLKLAKAEGLRTR